MSVDQLSTVFGALADPTRRAILARLAEGDLAVRDLAAPFPVSQPAISRHLKVLESAGLISRSRRATARLSHLEAEPLREATAWLARYQAYWDEQLRAARRAARPAPAAIRAGHRQTSSQGEEGPKGQEAGRKDATMSKTTITAPAGVPFVDIEREFDAPAALVLPGVPRPRARHPVARATQVRDGARQVGCQERRRVPLRPSDATASSPSMACSTAWTSTTWSRPSSSRASPGHVSLDQLVIEDLGGGRSRVKSHSVFQSVADRDGMVEAGMAEGVNEGYDRLDELLVKLQQPVGAAR